MKKPVVISPEPRCFPDDDLPEGWKFVTILDACEVNPSKPSKDFLPADAPVTFVPMPAVDADMGAITNPQIKPYLEVRNGFTSFRDGDVIMAKITPCMENGKAAIVKGMKNGIGFGSTEFHVMRSRGEILPEYLYYYIRQESFRNEAESHFTGSVGQKRVPADFIKQSMIPLPPLTEQQRIVARVEALLMHINAARDRLSRVPLIMKKFRQAVLAAACSGRLMDESDGYESRSAGELFADARYGTSNKCDYIKEQKIPVLRIPNIATGKLELTDLKFGDLTDKEIQRLAVQEGDLIICRTNGSLDLVGKAAIIPNLSEQFVFASYLIRVRVNQNLLLPEYYHICLTGQIGRDHIEEMARSTAGQFNLNLEILRTMPIPLPPLAEQQEIVRRVGLLFERADAFDQEVVAAGRRCERLTQAVLGKAFAGKL